jgi:hypothetical protein
MHQRSHARWRRGQAPRGPLRCAVGEWHTWLIAEAALAVPPLALVFPTPGKATALAPGSRVR